MAGVVLLPNQSVAQARQLDGYCPSDLPYCQPVTNEQITRAFFQTMPIDGSNLITDPNFQNAATWGSPTGFVSDSGGGATITLGNSQSTTIEQAVTGIAQSRIYRVEFNFIINEVTGGSSITVGMLADSAAGTSFIASQNCAIGVQYTFVGYFFTDLDPSVAGNQVFISTSTGVSSTIEFYIDRFSIVEMTQPAFSLEDCDGNKIDDFPTIQEKLDDPTFTSFISLPFSRQVPGLPFYTIYAPFIMLTLNWGSAVKGCYKICWEVGEEKQCSECFEVGCKQPLVTLTYSSFRNAFGFPYRETGEPVQYITFVGVLHSPNYSDEINDQYLTGGGERIPLFAHSRKIYKLATGRMPEYMHDAIRVALLHSQVAINGIPISKPSGDYSPNWSNDSLLASVEVDVEEKVQNTFNQL